jgi:hypothetical protein
MWFLILLVMSIIPLRNHFMFQFLMVLKECPKVSSYHARSFDTQYNKTWLIMCKTTILETQKIVAFVDRGSLCKGHLSKKVLYGNSKWLVIIIDKWSEVVVSLGWMVFRKNSLNYDVF